MCVGVVVVCTCLCIVGRCCVLCGYVFVCEGACVCVCVRVKYVCVCGCVRVCGCVCVYVCLGLGALLVSVELCILVSCSGDSQTNEFIY